MRKNVRRSTRMLLDAGATFAVEQSRERVRAGISELFTLHASRFVTKGAETGFRADRREPFHAEVAERFFDRDVLRLFRLTMDGRTVATLYCFEYAGALFYFQGGIDPTYDKLSTGTVLQGYAINYAFDRGLHLFDFMRGDEAYKFRWTETTRRIVAVRMGVSWRGRAALAVRRQTIRAKRLVRRVATLRPAPLAPAAVPAPTTQAES
jgi:CelD/BcsL family acetyltransferase involved in cellulose biosynthesis